jgi:epoxyqueuosine reductase
MHYLDRHQPLKSNLDLLLPGVRSVVVVACNYYSSTEPSTEFQVARYARGDDYHGLMKAMLEQLITALKPHYPELEARAFVDSGPLLERELAVRAGLGWLGKNSCLIVPGQGSWFLLGALLTNLDLDLSQRFESLHCGSCTRCLDACPTDAFVAPYTLDARKCIAYLTIETREEIPEELREGVGSHMFGCDICQEVCPWNLRFAKPTSQPAFFPRDWLKNKSLAELLLLTPHEFELQIAPRSPIKRPKYRGFIRNLAIVIGNSGQSKYLPVLAQALDRHVSDAMLALHLRWAMERLTDVSSPVST